jgi:hypothetical protein
MGMAVSARSGRSLLRPLNPGRFKLRLVLLRDAFELGGPAAVGVLLRGGGVEGAVGSAGAIRWPW